MISDWHTKEGMKSLDTGKLWEGKLYNKLRESDERTEWISQKPDNYYMGFDMKYKGLQIEVKSNDGWDWQNKRAYETVCVELTTKAGRPIGWMSGNADVVAFINIWERACYLYRSSDLKRFLKGRRTFNRHNAICTTMKWQEVEDAGFIKKISLEFY
jgi:hypothetical protein